MAEPIIDIRNVTKRFGNLAAVDNVSLTINAGEFFVLLGPSGCGKTTLLRMIAGFELPTEGQILIDGQDMASVPPNKRPVNMVFQSYAVFPHMTVAHNVGYGLQDRAHAALGNRRRGSRKRWRWSGSTGSRRASPTSCRAASASASRSPAAWSCGPRCCCSTSRLSALDAKLRAQMQFELAEIQDKVGITFVTVTHDQDEALSLATRIAVINKGQIAQIAGCSDLYEYPANRFVADFIGSVNIFDGRMVVDEPERAIIDCPEIGRIFLNHGVTGPHNADLWVAIRPEKITLSKAGPGCAQAIRPTAPTAPTGSSAACPTSATSPSTRSSWPAGGGSASRGPICRAPTRTASPGTKPVSMHWHPSSPVVLLA